MKKFIDILTEIEITKNINEYDFPSHKAAATDEGYEILGWATMTAKEEGGWDHKKMMEMIESEFGEEADYYGEGEELNENSAAFLIVR